MSVDGDFDLPIRMEEEHFVPLITRWSRIKWTQWRLLEVNSSVREKRDYRDIGQGEDSIHVLDTNDTNMKVYIRWSFLTLFSEREDYMSNGTLDPFRLPH